MLVARTYRDPLPRQAIPEDTSHTLLADVHRRSMTWGRPLHRAPRQFIPCHQQIHSCPLHAQPPWHSLLCMAIPFLPPPHHAKHGQSRASAGTGCLAEPHRSFTRPPKPEDTSHARADEITASSTQPISRRTPSAQGNGNRRTPATHPSPPPNPQPQPQAASPTPRPAWCVSLGDRGGVRLLRRLRAVARRRWRDAACQLPQTHAEW